MTNETVTIRSLLIGFTTASVAAGEQAKKASEKVQGAYSAAVKAAILAGDAETFRAEVEAFEQDIRENVGGLAKKVKAKAGTDKEGKPTGTYVIPGALSSAKSVLLACFKYGISMTDDSGEPASFGGLRKAKAAADEAERIAGLKGEALQRHELAAMLETLKGRVEKMAADQVAELSAICKAAVEATAPKAILKPTKADKAATLAKAA